tara:strand:+ start:530 stop:913 length:384 start_codon:yes stop_codon:yes gene_type:complete
VNLIKDKMAKARAAKKPPTYKNVHPDVKALDDDHYLSLTKVKEWEKHNKLRVKELKPLIRKASGKDERELRRELFNREGYLKNIATYLDTATWLDLFYGKDQEHKMKWTILAYACDEEGYRKQGNMI